MTHTFASSTRIAVLALANKLPTVSNDAEKYKQHNVMDQLLPF